MVLKSWKTFHNIQKLYSNLMSNPRRGGSTVGCLQPLRTALHTISISLQKFETELKGSKSTHLMPAGRTLPVYPVVEDEKSKASDEKSVKRKIA